MEPFQSDTYLDDGMLVEPALGRRPQLSAACYEAAMELVLGPGAVSSSKKEAEGQWDTTAIILGLHVDTETERVSLPGQKMERLGVLLDEPQWQRGCKKVILKDVQVLVGVLTHFASVL